MGVQMSEAEVWDFVRAGHTAMMTTLRADGGPLTLPVWFAVEDTSVFVRTPARSRKVTRVRRDPRVCVLVEAGHSWSELRAVVITGMARIVDDEAVQAHAMALIADKYEGLGVPTGEVPEATRRHYDTASVVIAVEPTGPPISWDNRKLRRPR